MADLDKDSLINMLGSILGENKAQSNSSEAKTQNINTDALKNVFSQSTDKNDTSNLLDTTALMSKMTEIVGKLNQTKNNREFALLSAIKPYMREERKPKIDTCLRILQVVNVLNTMK